MKRKTRDGDLRSDGLLKELCHSLKRLKRSIYQASKEMGVSYQTLHAALARYKKGGVTKLYYEFGKTIEEWIKVNK